MYQELLDKIVSHFTGDKFSNEIAQAKGEFFGPTGAEEDDSHQFDHKMSQFLDWYIFDRDLSDLGLTPVESVKELGTLKVDESDREKLKYLLKRRHSLFEFIKIKGSDITVKDLIARKKFIIKNSPITVGFSRDEIFEARLIPDGKYYSLTTGICFHPSEAKKFVLKEIKKIKKLGEPEQKALIERLSKMRLKFDQYKHIKCDYIYTNDEKLRI